MSEMLIALYIMGGLGLLVGIGLAFASKIFYVWVDPKIISIEDELPGANCGGCGLPGCSANAEAIVAGKAEPNSCVAAGSDVAEAIAGIMGVSVEAREPDIALPGCTYGVQDADTKFVYNGMNDCRAAMMLSGGMKVCSIGCLGLGTCANVCPFDAISMGPDGLPKVNEGRCTGCGTCEKECPKNIITLSSVTRRIIKEYTTDECTTPCQRACPAGININEYIRQISLGDYTRAVQVIKERNPFPTVIGRICPRPCENECRRQFVDEPVAINYLKRFAADYERKNKNRVQPFKAPETGRSVAVIGGGVEGLSTAFFTARLGHSITVYEATDSLGGLLRKAIASYRLPLDMLDWDIKGILEMGVKAETLRALGKNITIESLLLQGYQAVFLASGGWDNRLSRGAVSEPEVPVPGVYLLLDVIKTGSNWLGKVSDRSEIIIAGGGKYAIQAAMLCKEKGGGAITVMFRESRENSPITESEIEKAASENIKILFGTAILRLAGQENEMTGLELINLETSSTEHIPAKMLILASGRFPELIITRPQKEDRTEDEQQAADQKTGEEETSDETNGPLTWEAVEPYKEPENMLESGIFAKGDALTDYSAAIKAIGAGRRAAASIHQVLYGISMHLPENAVNSQSSLIDVDHLENVKAVPREIMPLRREMEMGAEGEIEPGFEEISARREADRCLKCGLICYARTEKTNN